MPCHPGGRTGGTPRSLQESYGEFYSELASKGYGSWREYLLRQLLWGKFCLYAQQAAAGTLPTSPDAPLHQARHPSSHSRKGMQGIYFRARTQHEMQAPEIW